MPADKKTIGVTKANASPLTSLVEKGRFASEMDAAKYAMAYALKNGIVSGATDGADTKWNVGSIDPDGTVRALIEALCPQTNEPYRLIEHLMNEGIRLLADKLQAGADIYELIFNDPSPPSPTA